jgi:hypothetical protein
MKRTCLKCDEQLPAKAEWCPNCRALTPGTILPGWALTFGLLFLSACLYCLYSYSVNPKPNYLMALGPSIPFAYKFLSTYFRLIGRNKPIPSA